MIQGYFLPSAPNVPVFSLLVSSEDAVTNPLFVLDTGFSGDLKVNPQTAEDLGLEPIASTDITIANGQTVRSKVALAYTSMEGIRNAVSVVIEEGTHLAGIGLFTKFGYKAIVDCKNRTVELHKA
jgi:predicted aspartyl protease